MVLLARIELATSPLPRECSTTELQQQLERFVASQPESCKPRKRFFVKDSVVAVNFFHTLVTLLRLD